MTPSRPALRPPQTGPGGSREVLGAAPRHQVASLFCACVSSLGEAEGSSPACSNFLTHLVEVSYGAPPLSSLYLSLHTFPPCLLFLCDTRMVVSHGCKTVCLCPGSLGGNQVRVHASSFVLTIFPLFLSLFPSRSDRIELDVPHDRQSLTQLEKMHALLRNGGDPWARNVVILFPRDSYNLHTHRGREIS